MKTNFLLFLDALVFCSFPQISWGIHQYQIIDGKLDPEWSDYISLIQGEYNEIVTPTTELWPFRTNYSERRGWSLAGTGEAPFLVALYSDTFPKEIKMDNHNFCGGALISPNKLITICACVSIWWFRHAVDLRPEAELPFSNDWMIMYEKDIYVSIAPARFVKDRKYKLVHVTTRDNILYPASAYGCAYSLTTGNPMFPFLSLVGVPFEPTIEHIVPSMFLPWPPVQMNHTTRIRATSYSLGTWTDGLNTYVTMDDNFQRLYINLTTVSITWKQTTNESCFADIAGAEFRSHPNASTRMGCFQPTDANPEVCWGTPGWPVISGGWPVGLTSWPLPCVKQKGKQVMMVTLFDKKARAWTVKYVGKKKLMEQNTLRPPLYREEQHFKNLVDYLDVPAGLSSADDFSPDVYLSSLAPFLIYVAASSLSLSFWA